MKQETKILIGVLVLTVVLLIGGVFFLSAKQPQATKNQNGDTIYQIDYSKGEKIGTDSAKVKVVEFGDLRCPACKAAEPTVEQVRILPNVQFIFRNFAFLGSASVTASNAALCAGEQGKFWQMHDYFYQNQPPETDTSLFKSENLVPIAKNLGLNETQFKACLDASKYQQNINDDLTEGNLLGVNSTPTFFLNGKKLVLINFSDLSNAVKAALTVTSN